MTGALFLNAVAPLPVLGGARAQVVHRVDVSTIPFVQHAGRPRVPSRFRARVEGVRHRRLGQHPDEGHPEPGQPRAVRADSPEQSASPKQHDHAARRRRGNMLALDAARARRNHPIVDLLPNL